MFRLPTNKFGSKEGEETKANISPDSGSIATTHPLFPLSKISP